MCKRPDDGVIVYARTAAGIGVKQQEDSVDSDVGGRNQPGMVVAVHIGAGDFVKVKGQVFEVGKTDFDDHDVTLWFVGGNALKYPAGCPVEEVSAPVAAGIRIKEKMTLVLRINRKCLASTLHPAGCCNKHF